jgi:hypothetical protein
MLLAQPFSTDFALFAYLDAYEGRKTAPLQHLTAQ